MTAITAPMEVGMAQVLVRGLPDDVVARLRVRAEHEGRSLEAHLRVVLTEASRIDRSAFIAVADRIAAETAHLEQTDSTEIVREARREREEHLWSLMHPSS